MITDLGSKLLYRNASGLEKAMADVDAEILLELKAELIIESWDPWQVSLRNLPFLAWGMGVTLWEEGWLEHTQREWTANSWLFKSLRGTVRGVMMALDFMGRDFTGGYDLLQVVAPPQGFYASPDLTKEEMDEWVRRMPEFRIQLAHGSGTAQGDEWFVGEGVIDVHATGRDDGPALYGRRVILRRNGVDTPLGMVEWQTTSETRVTTDFERVFLPGDAGAAFIVGEDHVEEDKFIDAEIIVPQIVSYRLDSHYEHVTSNLHLSTVNPGLEPLDVQFERRSDIGQGGPFFFMNDFVDDGFIDSGLEAAIMLADRLYLLDPDIAAPMGLGVSFVGFDRIGFPKYQAELLIDLKTHENEPAWIVGETGLGESFLIAENSIHQDRALRAVVAAKAQRDKALVSFEVTAPVAYGDFITETTLFGDQRRTLL